MTLDKSKPLADDVCLVTGGSSGIGRAIALRFAAEGAAVAVVARDESELEGVAAEIVQRGGVAEAVVADVADPAAMSRAVEQVVTRWGSLNLVVANAGINGVWAPVDELSVDEWRQTLDVNLTGTFITIKSALSALKSCGGSIIIMSSVNGTRIFSNPGATAYSCSKAGQVALAKMLALELAKWRIRVNVICPGAIETPISDKTVARNLDAAKEPIEFPAGSVPLTDGRPGTPDQIASLALFLASRESSHITGAVIHVDGGESLLRG